MAAAEEVIHQTKITNSKGYLIKLDFEKAYDMVNWECLLEVLERRGFGPKWITWVRMRLYLAKFNILVNGQSRKEIRCR